MPSGCGRDFHTTFQSPCSIRMARKMTRCLELLLLGIIVGCTVHAFECPNPPAPAQFDIKKLEGLHYDYLSTADYDAQTFCVTAAYKVVGDGMLNISVNGWHNGPPHSPGAFEKGWSLLLKNTGDGNPSRFNITAASMPVFEGTIINFYWLQGGAFSWTSCSYEGDNKYGYEIHGLYKVGTTFTGDHINSMQSAYFKNNLNPQNTSLKISPHPHTFCSV